MTSDENTDLRAYLSLSLDQRILVDDRLFLDAQRDIVDARTGHHVALPLFDEDFYLSQRGTRLPSNTSPLRDYFDRGARLRLSPHPIVDVDYVLASRGTDAGDAASGAKEQTASANPLIRLLSTGGGDCAPNRLFDPMVYRKAAEKRGTVDRNPLLHYLENWQSLHKQNALQVSEYFDPAFFDLMASRTSATLIDPVSQYFRHPAGERPDCNPNFHAGYYRVTNNLADEDGLSHFIAIGAYRGLMPNPYARDELGIGSATLTSQLIGELLLQYIKLR